MNTKSPEQLLAELETYSKSHNLSKKEVAKRLNIPYSTFKKWFLKGNIRRTPSQFCLDRVSSFVRAEKKIEQYWEERWAQILKWWETQHRYSSVQNFADEIGWEAEALSHHLQNKELPPQVILEKISEILGLKVPSLDSNVQTALSKAEKIKYLLILLEDELRWFRDTSEPNRNVLRETLDFADVGYISSLMTMISDEGRFQRWSALTTNRFNYFRKRGETKNEKGPD